MPHIRFNWVDIFFVTLLIRVCYIGFKNGFIPEIFRFLGLLTAFIFSFNNYTLLSSFLFTHLRWKGTEPELISFVSIFLAILFIFKVFSAIAHLFLVPLDISWANRLIGLLMSFGRWILLTGVIYTLFVNSPFEYLAKSAEEGAFIGRYISGVAPYVYGIGMDLYPWKKVETPLVKVLER